jgi:hypothetical protein
MRLAVIPDGIQYCRQKCTFVRHSLCPLLSVIKEVLA